MKFLPLTLVSLTSSNFFFTLSMASSQPALSEAESTWNIRSTTVVICRPRMKKVNGFGFSAVII